MNEKTATNIIYRLIDENCFAPDGRLGVYPEWLSHEDMKFLVSIGVFRRETGNLENLMHTAYYLNPCCDKQALSNDCTWPGCMSFHFKRAKNSPPPPPASSSAPARGRRGRGRSTGRE